MTCEFGLEINIAPMIIPLQSQHTDGWWTVLIAVAVRPLEHARSLTGARSHDDNVMTQLERRSDSCCCCCGSVACTAPYNPSQWSGGLGDPRYHYWSTCRQLLSLSGPAIRQLLHLGTSPDVVETNFEVEVVLRKTYNASLYFSFRKKTINIANTLYDGLKL